MLLFSLGSALAIRYVLSRASNRDVGRADEGIQETE